MPIHDADVLREECYGNAAPDAAETMHLCCLQRIIDLQLLHELTAEAVDKGTDDADAEGGPSLDDVTASSDADEAGKNTVRDALKVEEHILLGRADVRLDEEGDDASCAWRDNSVDNDELSGFAAITDDATGRTTIEK